MSAAGKLTLLFKGKPVGQIKSGRYTFQIDDQTREGRLQGAADQEGRRDRDRREVRGKHKVTVPLDAGQWWFFSGSGKRTYFIVVK